MAGVARWFQWRPPSSEITSWDTSWGSSRAQWEDWLCVTEVKTAWGRWASAKERNRRMASVGMVLYGVWILQCQGVRGAGVAVGSSRS